MAVDRTNGVSPAEESSSANGLTPIHSRIHCAATQEVETLSETDRLQLDHLFNVLADVALSVAKRSLATTQVKGTCEQ